MTKTTSNKKVLTLVLAVLMLFGALMSYGISANSKAYAAEDGVETDPLYNYVTFDFSGYTYYLDSEGIKQIDKLSLLNQESYSILDFEMKFYEADFVLVFQVKAKYNYVHPLLRWLINPDRVEFDHVIITIAISDEIYDLLNDTDYNQYLTLMYLKSGAAALYSTSGAFVHKNPVFDIPYTVQQRTILDNDAIDASGSYSSTDDEENPIAGTKETQGLLADISIAFGKVINGGAGILDYGLFIGTLIVGLMLLGFVSKVLAFTFKLFK